MDYDVAWQFETANFRTELRIYPSAERTYKACLRSAAQLKRLVPENFEELLYGTERL